MVAGRDIFGFRNKRRSQVAPAPAEERNSDTSKVQEIDLSSAVKADTIAAFVVFNYTESLARWVWGGSGVDG